MDATYYKTIFKRKSFHLFRGVGSEKLSEAELGEIRAAWAGFEPLCPEIRTAIEIIPAAQAGRPDGEYCVLIYSEAKDNWLMNAGYLGEQLDLWLTARNIGSLWFGMGKPEEKQFQGLDYAIMFVIRKVSDEKLFRADMFKAKRKALGEIWQGDTLGAAEIARFAPSAVNSQPWFVKNEDGALTVYRYKKQGRIGLMPPAAVRRFNRIDLGIFLCVLEICLAEQKIAFTRELFVDDGDLSREYTKCAVYRLGGQAEAFAPESSP